ncbi:hypothetical protein ACMFMG_010917 [Clarireedia jacksonii]
MASPRLLHGSYSNSRKVPLKVPSTFVHIHTYLHKGHSLTAGQPDSRTDRFTNTYKVIPFFSRSTVYMNKSTPDYAGIGPGWTLLLYLRSTQDVCMRTAPTFVSSP